MVQDAQLSKPRRHDEELVVVKCHVPLAKVAEVFSWR
jgi:hypothetical protein